MRDSNIIKDDFNSEPEIIIIDEVPEYNHKDYDLYDEKDFKKYITDIERMVRNSIEYKNMVKYLRENMDMNKCSFYENVNNIDTFKIKIHIHHHPFTLYDLALIVYKKRSSYGEDIDVEDVAKEVMHLHYNMLVGLIPLAETPHQLVHNKYLFVPLDRVYGAWEDFYNMYSDFIEDDYKELINENIARTAAYKETEEELAVLNKKYIYLDITGAYDLPDFQAVINSMNKKIAQINEENNKRFDPTKKRKILYYENESNNSIF